MANGEKEAGASQHTIQRYLAELKALLNKAVEWEQIEFNPLQGLSKQRAEDNKRVRYLSDDERKRLLNALDEREKELRQKRQSHNQWRISRKLSPVKEIADNEYADHLKPMIILALNTGMRRGEIFKLQWKNINYTTNTITVEASNAKSKKTRHIPLNVKAANVLKIWGRQNPENILVFPNSDGGTFNNIKKAWSNLMNRAEIENFRFHDLRHDFASQLVMKGVDLYVLKELLGHSTIQMTERYAHLAPKHLENAVNLLTEN